MIFSSAVKFSSSRCSSEVFIHSSAAPGVPPLPGVASLARGAAGPGSNGIQQAQQHQQRYHQHCGMAGERRLWRKNGELLPGSRGPIKKSGSRRWRAPVLRTSEPRDSVDSTAAPEVGSAPRLCLCCCWKSLLWIWLRASAQTERRYKRSLWRQ